jgi:hypothetical protein
MKNGKLIKPLDSHGRRMASATPQRNFRTEPNLPQTIASLDISFSQETPENFQTTMDTFDEWNPEWDPAWNPEWDPAWIHRVLSDCEDSRFDS